MTLLAPTLQVFFTDRLIGQRQASPHTIAAYRDTLRLRSPSPPRCSSSCSPASVSSSGAACRYQYVDPGWMCPR
jgi:hypothetical protein